MSVASVEALREKVKLVHKFAPSLSHPTLALLHRAFMVLAMSSKRTLVFLQQL